MALSFASILSKKVSEIEAVENLPIGSYIAQVMGHKLGKVDSKTGGAGWDTVDIQFAITQACEDVDTDALANFGSGVAGEKLSRRFMFSLDDERSFHITENQVKELFAALDLEPDASIGDNLTAMVGRYAKITVIHRANSQNPERPFVEIRGVVAA